MSTDEVSIRRARPADAPVLAHAERVIAATPGRLASRPHELKDDAFTEKIISLNNDASGLYVVIEEKGEIAGHALLDPLKLDVTSHVFSLTLAVHDGFERRGLGKRLMTHLIEWARAHDEVEKIELHVRSSNQAAIALYESLGFQLEGRLIKRLKIGPGNYLDDLCMGLWVGP